MKKTKAILMALCAVLLVAASVMGTLAYLTSTATVTNTFTVGKVEITLDEAKVNVNGQKLDTDNNVDDATDDVALAARVQKNDYKLMPGHTYAKDPIVHVTAGSENCYLFVKVVNEIAAIEDGNNTVADQMEAKGWAPINEGSDVYVYIGLEPGATAPLAVDGGTNVPVFDQFKIADDVNNEATLPTEPEQADAAINTRQLSLYNEKQIIVTAYAVQADGFADKTAAQIWGDAGFS